MSKHLFKTFVECNTTFRGNEQRPEQPCDRQVDPVGLRGQYPLRGHGGEA